MMKIFKSIIEAKLLIVIISVYKTVARPINHVLWDVLLSTVKEKMLELMILINSTTSNRRNFVVQIKVIENGFIRRFCSLVFCENCNRKFCEMIS